MFDIVLSEGSEASFLSEHPVLPAVEQNNLQGFIPFPRLSPTLLDLSLFEQALSIPRFSLFSGQDIDLNGFRLLHKSGSFFHDASLVEHERSATEDFLAKCRSGQSEDIEAAYIREPDPSLINIHEEVLILSSDEPSNFGSWIYRFLPKLLLSLPHIGSMPIFTYTNPWIARILDFVVPGRTIIPQNPRHRYRLARPVVPSLPAPHVLFRPEIILAMHALIERAPPPPVGMEKIYVSRRKQSLSRIGHRVFESETELVETLAERGFREFFPEDHSFEEQVSIFANARIIIGCGGSNMFGCVFARSAEMIVDIESSTDWAFAHSNLFSSVASAYSMVRGVPTSRGSQYHRNWMIEPKSFISGFDDISAKRPKSAVGTDPAVEIASISPSDRGRLPNFLRSQS